jgi:hypothetical protein
MPTMHMLVAGKAHHRPGAFHSRHIGVSYELKENCIFNGIDKQSRAGRGVAFDGTKDLEPGGRSCLLIWALYSVLEQ